MTNEATYEAKEALIRYIDAIAETNPNLASFAAFQANANTFTVETHGEYSDDAERYNVALSTAQMVVDWPEGYGFDANTHYGTFF